MISYPMQVGTTLTRVIEAGRGADPIVFIHGVSSYAHRFARNLDAFSDSGHRAYSFDLPGHGFAAKGEEFDYSVAGYSHFLESFLGLIDARPAVLVGASLGGHVAAALACRRPEKVRSLVLVGSLGIVAAGEGVRRMIAAAILDTGREGIGRKLRRAHADASLVTGEWIEEEFRINNSPGAREAFERLAAYIGSSLDEDCLHAALAQLARRIPVLLVWGEHDSSVDLSVAHAAHGSLPGSRLAVIRDAGHAPYYEKPGVFNAVVKGFLSGAFDARPAGEVMYH